MKTKYSCKKVKYFSAQPEKFLSSFTLKRLKEY